MTGDYPAQLVQVQDIIQNGQCTGPVAEPVVWGTPRVVVMFVCRAARARTIRHPAGSTRRSPDMAPSPRAPELLDAAAEITGRRIVGVPLPAAAAPR